MRHRWLALGAIVLTFATAGAPAARAASAPITVADYAARLDAAIAAMHALPADGHDQVSIESVLAAIGLPLEVDVSSGMVATVTQDALVGGAASAPDAYDATLARLQAARDTATGMGSGPDPAAIQRSLDAAYGGGTAASPSVFSRIASAIGQALGWVIDRTLGALVRAGFGGLVAVAAIVLLLLLGIGVLRKAGTGLVSDYRAPGPARAQAIDWRAEAERALASGDLKAAVRACYHVLLEVLASYGVVEDAPGLTAGECREAVRRARPTLYPDIRAATRTFERVAYGDDPAVAEDVALLREAERKVRAS